LSTTQIKRQILSDILYQGPEGCIKLAASMVWPLRVKLGYDIGLGDAGIWREEPGLELTQQVKTRFRKDLSISSPDFETLDMGLDGVREKLREPIKETWAQLILAMANQEPKNLDTLDAFLADTPGDNIWVVSNAKMYARLLPRNPQPFAHDGQPTRYRTARYFTLRYLNDFSGVAVVRQGAMNIQIEVNPVINGDSLNFDIVMNWGVKPEILKCFLV